MRFKGTVELARARNVVLVPRDAVFMSDRGPSVYLRRLLSVDTVPVRIGRENDQSVEVLSGVHAGDRVLIAKADKAEAKTSELRKRVQELEHDVKIVRGRLETEKRVFIVQKGELELAADRYAELRRRHDQLRRDHDELVEAVRQAAREERRLTQAEAARATAPAAEAAAPAAPGAGTGEAGAA
jgi:G3E family GTPase